MDYRVHTDRNKRLLKALCYPYVGWLVSPDASSMSHVECSNNRQYRPPMRPLKKLISYTADTFLRHAIATLSALCHKHYQHSLIERVLTISHCKKKYALKLIFSW